jgi:sodium transport system permease protein
MRFPMIQAIYVREMLDMFRDRRTMISMVAVPVLVFPLLFQVMTRVMGNIEKNAKSEAKTMGIAVRVSTPSVRDAIAKLDLPIVDKEDLREAVGKKEIAAAVEEVPGTPPQLRVYVDVSNPTSSAAGDTIRAALTELRDEEIRERLRNSGIDARLLNPFVVQRTNVADENKMAGATLGTVLGYVVLLMMFTGGMYPIIDMTAGEKERKTLETLLSSPVSRQEIVMGKTLAAMSAILVTTALMVASMAYSFRNLNLGRGSEEVRQMMGGLHLDPSMIAMFAAILIPVAIFAASVMFAIALFARSFKEGQSYLTPIALVVIFPAILGGLPGVHLTPVLSLIPIFNASMMLHGVLTGDFSNVNFAVTMAANLGYAAIAFVIAVRQFGKESVLFRS